MVGIACAHTSASPYYREIGPLCLILLSLIAALDDALRRVAARVSADASADAGARTLLIT